MKIEFGVREDGRRVNAALTGETLYMLCHLPGPGSEGCAGLEFRRRELDAVLPTLNHEELLQMIDPPRHRLRRWGSIHKPLPLREVDGGSARGSFVNFRGARLLLVQQEIDELQEAGLLLAEPYRAAMMEFADQDDDPEESSERLEPEQVAGWMKKRFEMRGDEKDLARFLPRIRSAGVHAKRTGDRTVVIGLPPWALSTVSLAVERQREDDDSLNLGWIDGLGVNELKAELGKATVRYRAYQREIEELRLQLQPLAGRGVGCPSCGTLS